MIIISVLLIIVVQKEDVYTIQYPANQILVLEIHATQRLDVLIPQLFVMIITHVQMMVAIQKLDVPSIRLIVTMEMLVLMKNVIQFLAVYTQNTIVMIMISAL
jgi:hypothetical protein